MNVDNREFNYRDLVDSESTKETWEELYQLAYYDKDTGLPNKNYWDMKAPKIYDDVVKKHQGELCIAFIDLDWLKIWNSENGHLKTDQLLADVGKLMATEKRGFRLDHDLVTRWGGDEFAVALPYTPIEKAAEACQRVLEHLKTLESKYIMEPTATIGVASSKMGFKDFSSLVKAADDTLTQAKQNPQNKGQIYVCRP